MNESVAKAANALKDCKHIVFLIGAGMSTNAGIPDFRSDDGLYAKYGEDLFHRTTLVHQPQRIYDFVREYFGQKYEPTAAHRVLKLLQDRGVLRCVLTQNIDGLECDAGIDPVRIEYLHGSLATFRCTNDGCDGTITGQEYARLSDSHPTPIACWKCNGAHLLRPDIVMFGEALCDLTIESARSDLLLCDAFVCIGTSLKVDPAASLPLEHVRQSAKRVWINRDPPPESYDGFFTHELLGDCDEKLAQLFAIN